MKQTGRERSQAVQEGVCLGGTDERRTGWFPLRGVTESGTVRWKGPNNEARILGSALSPAPPPPHAPSYSLTSFHSDPYFVLC